jgi:hypothetical protein
VADGGPRPPHLSQARGEPLNGAVPDRIAVRGLTGHGFHGVYPAEREHGQTFRVDAVLELDTAPAAATDDLARTVNYAELAQALHAVLVGDRSTCWRPSPSGWPTCAWPTGSWTRSRSPCTSRTPTWASRPTTSR